MDSRNLEEVAERVDPSEKGGKSGQAKASTWE